MLNRNQFILIVCLLSALSTSYLAADDSVIVFNEIQYHPPADLEIEWVELRNLFAIDVDVSKWSLRGGISYSFPEGTIIPAHGYLVVTDSPALMEQILNPDSVQGPFSGNLSNSGEQLRLYNNDNRIMDTVDYKDSGDWPVAPDGSGVTLAKRKPATATNSAKNWTWSAEIGGTPGKTNFPEDEIKPVRHPVIGFHDTWRYDDSGSNKGSLWRYLGYNDSAWGNNSAAFYSGQPIPGDTPTAITTLYSTGCAEDGSVLSPGQADPHYFITSSGGSLTVMQNHPAWVANDSVSMWIGYSAQGTDNQPGGNYSFSTTFNLAGWLAETAKVSFYVAVDNELLDVKINGVSTGITSIGHDAFRGPFTIHSGFVPGTNRIDFLFQNWDIVSNPMGLRVAISGTAIPIVGNTQIDEGPVTHYFRKPFVYNGNPSSFMTVDINHLVDDGAVFYLNGLEIYRHNMPEGSIHYGTPAFEDIAEPHTSGFISIPVSNMIVGTNLFAVEVHQSIQNDDVLFAAEVQATETASPFVEPAQIAFNEIASAMDNPFHLELVNYGDAPIELANYIIVCYGSVHGEYTLPAQSLDSGDFLVLDNETLGFHPLDEDRLFLYSAGKKAVLDAAIVKNSHRGRYPEGTGDWQYPNIPTWGSENSFHFNQDIVINEILYNHCTIQSQEAQYQTNLLLQGGATAKTLVPMNDSHGSEWTGANEPFDDSDWNSGVGSTTGIGYEDGSSNDYIPWIGTNVFSDMYNINRSVYVRIPFSAPGPDDIDTLNLKIAYDDAFIAYLNGREVARSAYVPTSVRWDLGASNGHEATGFEVFNITEHKDILRAGQNILAIHGFNYGLASSDLIFLPELEVKQQISPKIDGGESSEEWIEIYNKSDGTIDLSGWKIEGQVDYEFPQGTTMVGGEYLIIANNPIELAAKYPDIRIVGEYNGRLPNKAGLITLIDSNKNIVDDVHYYDSQPWPEYADGRNASLELRQPDADNSKAMAWQASKESSRSSWNTYSYRKTAMSSAVGPDGQWNEFILGLLDAGEILLDDIKVIEDPRGSAIQLIQNGTFESGTADKWRILGNHSHSEIILDPDNPANHVLRLIATGTTGHMHNHAETTLANGRSIVNGREYEISYRAKWIAGSNQLNSRLYFNRVAQTTLIAVPDRNGTPGRQNSRYESNIGPTFSDLRHTPPVPVAGEPVTVSVRAEDPHGIFGVTLFWRIDGQSWNSRPMSRNADGQYQAQIPAQSGSTVVQFYVQAADSLGKGSVFPPQGADSRALFKIDDNLAAENGLNNFRIIMLSDDYAWMHTNINLMSDDRVGATVIYNENEVFYDAGVRLKSSQRHRLVAEHVGFNVEFCADHLFSGIHESVAIDRSEGVMFGQREMLIHQTLNRAGSCQLTKYSDLIKVIAPAIQHTSSAELQLSRYNSIFLNDQFENGSDGQVYEYEYIYYPRFTVSGDPEDYKIPNDDGVTGKTICDYGDDKENYRWQFLQKNNLNEDNYQGLMNFAKAFGTTGSTFNNHVSEMIDIDQWLRAFAIAVVSGAGDSYGGDNSQHNMQIYMRPSDGRALYFPHDLDAFYSSTRPLIANSDLAKIIAVPGYERLYYGHVYDVLKTSYNTTYMRHWTDQLGQLLPSQPFASHLSFIGQRNSYLSSEIAQRVAPAYPFEISTYPSTIADSYAPIRGKAWIDVKEVYLQGMDSPLELSWSSTGSGTGKIFTWNASVPLEPGVNNLVFMAYDFQGNLIATKSITITSTVVERPLKDYLRVTEVMYNPIGGSDYEFIELYNSGPKTLDLTPLKMVEGETIRFDFSNSPVTSLVPGEYVLIVNNLKAFSGRYGASAMRIAGEYSGNLSNGGQTLTFTGLWNSPILSFEYQDSRGWPPAADGAGHSLVPVDSVLSGPQDGLLDYGGNWRQSAYRNGSPGRQDPDPPATIVLNEMMAHTDYSNPARPEYDSNDWIELYNPTTTSIHVSANQWFLSDDTENLKKWSIPETTIGAGDWIAFDEVTGFHNPITTGFGLDKAGEQLFLSYLPGTSQDRVVDCICFKAQVNGASLGRYPDGGNFWYTMSPSRESANTAGHPHLVISELMYSPLEGMQEYIELYNPTAEPIQLWDVETNCGWRFDGGIDYLFSADATIPAFGYMVVVPFAPNEANLSQFNSMYGYRPLVIVGPFNENLSDRGERIALEKPEAADLAGQPNSWAIVDEVIYFHRLPWTDKADATGMAIGRIRLNENGNNPAAWSSAFPKPGTPRCDFDQNGRIDIADFATIAESWMLESTDPNWNPEVNLDGEDSDMIDWSDMLILLDAWLWSSR